MRQLIDHPLMLCPDLLGCRLSEDGAHQFRNQSLVMASFSPLCASEIAIFTLLSPRTTRLHKNSAHPAPSSLVTTSVRGLYELIVSGRRRYQSDDAYASDEFPVLAEQWTFHKVKRVDEFAVGIDLAYVYIHMGGGSFRCLGKLLGLDCVVGVETIHLPYHIVEHTPRRQKPSTAHPHGPLMEQPNGVPFRSAETLLDATWIRFAKLLLPVQLSQFPGSDPRFPSPHGSS